MISIDLTEQEPHMRTDEAMPTDRLENESPAHDYLDEQEAKSFPSWDQHSDWAGPSEEAVARPDQATPTRGGEPE